MKRIIMLGLTLAMGWYVVKYSGETVAGPFTTLTDCNEMAQVMAARYAGVSAVCQYK